jgi:hypothetical protein
MYHSNYFFLVRVLFSLQFLMLCSACTYSCRAIPMPYSTPKRIKGHWSYYGNNMSFCVVLKIISEVMLSLEVIQYGVTLTENSPPSFLIYFLSIIFLHSFCIRFLSYVLPNDTSRPISTCIGLDVCNHRIDVVYRDRRLLTFISFLVSASKGGRSLCYWFVNYPLATATAALESQCAH